MLRQRILSALVMVPLVILGVLYLPAFAFAVVVALAMLLAAWEWSALVSLQAPLGRIGYLAATAATIALAWWWADSETFVNSVLWLAMAWWLFALFWMSRPALGQEFNVVHAGAKLLLGLGVLSSTWLALVVLHSRPDQGPHWVLYVLVLVWVADSGAYFVGKTLGRNKLAPAISPGKTWEGVFGALLASGVFAFAYATILELYGTDFSGFILVCVVTVLFSVAGDLLESLLKRQCGVKDSGRLIPGHGGILDRIDSLLAAGPVFLFGMRWIGL